MLAGYLHRWRHPSGWSVCFVRSVRMHPSSVVPVIISAGDSGVAVMIERAACGQIVGLNLVREFESEIDFDPEVLRPQNMIVVDGRMNPHEWLGTADGRLLKTDGATHGDDHFFPGPTDIAWDIAGAAVEWNLHPDALTFYCPNIVC